MQKKPDAHIRPPLQSVALWLRLAALCYDILLCAALLLLCTAGMTVLFGSNAIQGDGRVWLQSVLLLCVSSYYIGFVYFTHATPGMRAWRLIVVGMTGTLSIGQVCLRYFIGWCVFGWLFGLWKTRRTLQEYASQTITYRFPKHTQ